MQGVTSSQADGVCSVSGTPNDVEAVHVHTLAAAHPCDIDPSPVEPTSLDRESWKTILEMRLCQDQRIRLQLFDDSLQAQHMTRALFPITTTTSFLNRSYQASSLVLLQTTVATDKGLRAIDRTVTIRRLVDDLGDQGQLPCGASLQGTPKHPATPSIECCFHKPPLPH